MSTVPNGKTIGPITKFIPLCGSNNFAVVAQIPIPTDPNRKDMDLHYVYIVVVNGAEARCMMLPLSESSLLGAAFQ